MKKVKKALKSLAPKVFNFFIILLMLFQPVGTPSMLIAIAEGDPAAVVAPVPDSDPTPASEPAKEEAPAPEEEPAPAPVVEEPAPVVETVVEEPPVVAEPIVTDPAPDPAPVADPAPTADPVQSEAEPPVSPEAPVEPAPEPKETPAETPDETPAPTEPTEPTSSLLPVTPLDTFVPTISILDQTSIASTDQTCLTEGAAITTSAVSDWEVAGDVATTKEKVRLGVKYEFPGNKEVSVTFTCLPTVLSKISPLKIEQIASDKINLPDGVSAATDFAYDITTDGMENGDFKYDLILPKIENVGAKISYIEKSAEEVQNLPISIGELKQITDKIDQKVDTVEASDLDHFTVFFVQSDLTTVMVSPNIYLQGDTVYFNADNLDSSKHYQFAINPPGNNDSFLIGSCSTGNSTFSGSYLLPAAAGVSANWQVEIFQSNSCPNNANSNPLDSATFEVVLSTSTIPTGLLLSTLVSGCTDDTGGANDEPGQKDLTKMCTEYSNLPTSVDVLWNWDDTGWSGQNSGDGCSLFDTDGDGLINYSLCVIVKNTPATFDSMVLYSCGDGAINKCTNPIATITPSAGTTCNASVIATDPFPAGEDYPNDTEASCTISMSDVGGSVAELVDVCSYPSQQPNSDPSDCIVFQTKAGKLQVDKVLSPSSDAGKFNLQIDGSTLATDVGDGGSTGEQSASEGIHTVGEIEGTGTSLSNYSSSIVCKDLNGTGTIVEQSTDSGPLPVTVDDGDDIVCTITNTRINNGSITIVKDAVPNDAQDFAFTTTGTGLTGFSLDDDADGTLSNTKVFSDLAAGTYSVSEGAVTGWTSNGGVCSDESPVSAISLQAGENITCTFTNTRDTGTLRVLKNVDLNGDGDYTDLGETGATNWLWQANGGADHNTGDSAIAVNTGDYALTETSQTNFHPVGLSCEGGILVGNTVTVAKEANVVCTFTNARDTGNLKAQKIVDDQSDLTLWSFSLDGGNTVPANSSGLVDFGQVTTAVTHTIIENGPTGYHFVQVTGTNCIDNQDGSADATVATGGTTICTFNNDVDKVSITIIKDAVPDSDQNFGFTTTGNGLTNFTLDDDADGILSNSQTFSGLFPGLFSVTETGVMGWDLGPIACTLNQLSLDAINGNTVTRYLNPGDDLSCTFTNTKKGSITIEKQTVGGDGDFTFTGDVAGTLSDDETATMAVIPGSYTSTEGALAGWDLTNITCDDNDSSGVIATGVATFNVAAGEDVKCTFTNTERGHIIVDKVTNPSQLGQLAQSFSFNTTGSGYTGFNLTDQDAPNDQSLVPGTYTVTEVLPLENWQLDSIVCLYDDLSIGIPTEDENGKEIVLGAGDTVYCTFTNTQLSDVHGYKWNDEDGDGQFGEGEEKLAGWEIFIDENDNSLWDTGEPKTTTSDDLDPLHFGWYVFDDMLPGTYKICEVQQTGWAQTYPTPPCHTITLPENGSEEEEETNLITAIPYNFGNQFISPSLTIEKFNSQWPTVQTPGAVIDYTITVRAEDNNVNDVVVKDLLPEGFEFVSGLASQGSLTENYASPGTWGLGDMAAGDSVTITYKAKIGGSQDPGTYKDLAWAEGTSDISQTPDVLATSVAAPAPDNGIVDTNFVGTQIALAVPTSVAVELNEDRKTDTDTKTKRVLGAALPATGASPILPMVAMIMLIIGFNLIMEAKKREKRISKLAKGTIMKLIMLAVLSGTMLFFGGQVKAAGLTQVRIEEPFSPTNVASTNDFEIGFVTLDTDLSQNVTAQCFRMPGNIPITTLYDAQNGGNSGSCIADSPANGTYQFEVRAVGSQSVSDTTADIRIMAGTPGTPLNYDRDDDSCTATFTTANDGLTAKVELYRSTDLDFTADASTFAKEAAIGPNTSGSITDPNGNCDDYYYAIRAVSAAGAGSGFVGDEKVTVRHRTRTRTITIRPEAAGGAIPVGTAGVTTPGAEGTVGGAETEEGAGVGGGEEGQVLGEEGQVLGEAGEKTPSTKNSWPYYLAAAVILAFLLYTYLKKKLKS